MIYAKILADSRHPINRDRITTMELCYPRYIDAQFNMYRMFSRNGRSSRAVPTGVLAKEAHDATMRYYPKNGKGMVPTQEVELNYQELEYLWKKGALQAAILSAELAALGVHKEMANRPMEPFLPMYKVVTSCTWGNFFKQRIHAAAQGAIYDLAVAMKEALDGSVPVYSWNHIPYRLPEEGSDQQDRLCAAARCARVSYKTFDGTTDRGADQRLAQRLIKDGHWSPFEHVCEARVPWKRYDNYRSWRSLRRVLERS